MEDHSFAAALSAADDSVHDPARLAVRVVEAARVDGPTIVERTGEWYRPGSNIGQ